MEREKKEIESLNEKLYNELSIEELEKRLTMENLPDKLLEIWGCDCDGYDPCDYTYTCDYTPTSCGMDWW